MDSDKQPRKKSTTDAMESGLSFREALYTTKAIDDYHKPGYLGKMANAIGKALGETYNDKTSSKEYAALFEKLDEETKENIEKGIDPEKAIIEVLSKRICGYGNQYGSSTLLDCLKNNGFSDNTATAVFFALAEKYIPDSQKYKSSVELDNVLWPQARVLKMDGDKDYTLKKTKFVPYDKKNTYESSKKAVISALWYSAGSDLSNSVLQNKLPLLPLNKDEISKLKKATEFFEKALALDPLISTDQKKKEMIPYESLKDTPNDPNAWLQKGKAAMKKAKAKKMDQNYRLSEAEACYNMGLKYDPNNVELLIAKGIALSWQDRGSEADICYDLALEIDEERAKRLVPIRPIRAIKSLFKKK